MGVFAFCVATALGAGLWVLVLAGLGFWFGRNEQLVLQNLQWLTLILVAGCGHRLFYWRKWRSRFGAPFTFYAGAVFATLALMGVALKAWRQRRLREESR